MAFFASIRSAVFVRYHQAEPHVSAFISWSAAKISGLTTMGCDRVSTLASKVDHIFASRIKGWEPTVSWAKNHQFAVGIVIGIVICHRMTGFFQKIRKKPT